MTPATPTIDIARAIRIATFLGAALAGAIVYFAYEPQAAAAQQRIDDAQARLRSDEVAFSEVPHLRLERAELERRYSQLFGQNAEAVFLRELAATVRRHNVKLVTTSVSQDNSDAPPAVARPASFSVSRVNLELRGSYRDLLAAIGDLSLGSAIIAVEPPSMRRDGDTIAATVRAVIYEPPRGGAAANERGKGKRRP